MICIGHLLTLKKSQAQNDEKIHNKLRHGMLITEHMISNPLRLNREQLTIAHQREEYVSHNVQEMYNVYYIIYRVTFYKLNSNVF